jgi:2'-hydroxyisoflavone reductase
MDTTRRGFVQTVAGAAGIAMVASMSNAAVNGISGTTDTPAPAPASGNGASGSGKSLRILILGGTGFLGPAVVDAAKARGHALTLFNRGRTEKRIGIIDGVEKLYGNRDPKLHAVDGDDTSPQGLAQIEDKIKAGEKWDAIVDTSGYVPRIVKASAELLAKASSHYVFISTISVYASNDTPNSDETARIGTMGDPTIESMGAQSENYGPLKALCEQAAEAAMPGKVLNIRPGFIVGPGDPTDRFTYWPVRVSKGGDVLAPNAPVDPVQFIDVRDLAEWIIRCIENRTVGVMNATGPHSGDTATAFTIGKLLDACKTASKSDAKFTWIPLEFIEKQGIIPGADFPIWVPASGQSAGFHRVNVDRAVKAGLTFRGAEVTCRDTLAWWPKEVERRTRVGKQLVEDATKAGRPAPNLPDPKNLRAGLNSEREAAAFTAWKTRNGG